MFVYRPAVCVVCVYVCVSLCMCLSLCVYVCALFGQVAAVAAVTSVGSPPSLWAWRRSMCA